MEKVCGIYFVGEALRMLKYNYDASICYEQALQIQPNYIKGLFGLGIENFLIRGCSNLDEKISIISKLLYKNT
jgi:hypothetical protein